MLFLFGDGVVMDVVPISVFISGCIKYLKYLKYHKYQIKMQNANANRIKFEWQQPYDVLNFLS